MKKTILSLLLVCTWGVIFSEIPAGYYQKADKKRGIELLNALNEICSNGSFLGYGAGEGYTWEGFHYTDRDEDGKMRDMYSNTDRYQKGFEAVDGMHIEHSLPKSWWGALENYAYRDLHHLFPADAQANITKNNLPLGVVSEVTFDNGVSKIGENGLTAAEDKCFEPADEYKGDFARAYLYVATTYNEMAELWDSPMMDNNTYPVWKEWAIELLLKWHREDPVSEKERTRQEAVYEIQHNRNPYIDYPEMAEHIWGDKKDVEIILPEETRPYFVSPSRWEKLEMPITSVGSKTTKAIWFEGKNFTKEIKLEIKHATKGIGISTKSLSPEEIAQGKEVKIDVTSEVIETIVDTMQIMTERDTMEIEIKATFTDEFMITMAEASGATEAEIEWTATDGTEKYEVEINRGYPTKGGDLIIANYVEGTGYNKAIALYNGTGREVDLKYYSLKKQGNGNGEMRNEMKLSGRIKAGTSYVIVNAKADTALKEMANRQSTEEKDDVMNFNGNDAVGLFHNGIMTDIVGEMGNSDNWGENMTLRRKAYVNTPNKTYDKTEWEMMECNAYGHIKNHEITTVENTGESRIAKAEVNMMKIDGLIPGTRYNVKVKRDGKETINQMTFVTERLKSPEAYEATDIYDTKFTANWEEINHAEGYIVEVAEVTGESTKFVEEGFDSIGSNGTPLPEGWEGKVSGNYTTATSSGKSPNAIGMKKDGDWIECPKTETDMQSFEFMYRFPSAATGSYFVVSATDAAGKEREIKRVDYGNTKKNTLVLNATELGGGCRAVKITFSKQKGNLAIDDVKYSYGKETENLIKSIFAETTTMTIDGLMKEKQYAYRVAAVAKHGTEEESRSEWSNRIEVTTNNTTAPVKVENTTTETIVYTEGRWIKIADKPEIEKVEIYDMQGQCMYAGKRCEIYMEKTGIYIVRIVTKKEIRNYKTLIK